MAEFVVRRFIGALVLPFVAGATGGRPIAGADPCASQRRRPRPRRDAKVAAAAVLTAISQGLLLLWGAMSVVVAVAAIGGAPS